MKKCIILYLLFALCGFYAAGQTLPSNIELSSLLAVTQDSTITARNQIWLKPGFRFTAQTGKALYLKIAAGGIRVKHRNHSTGAPLSGGQFRITKANNVLVGNYTVSNGQTNVTNLDWGTYYITETVPPAGYDSIKATRTINVNANTFFETAYEYVETVIPPAPPITTGSVTVKFRDSQTSVPLNGRVKLKNSEGVLIDRYELSNGEVTIAELDSGAYQITEDIRPDGYQMSPLIRTVAVSAGNNEEVVFNYDPLVSYAPTVPLDTVPLKFRLAVHRHLSPYDGSRIDESVLDFNNTATRVGEYLWSQAFNDTITHFRWWTTDEFREVPIEDDFFDLYMPQIIVPDYLYRSDAEEFSKYYGKYYHNETVKYMSLYGSMLEGADATEATAGWGLPSDKDYRQLFAMCPFYQNGAGPALGEKGVRTALSPRPGENPLAVNIGNTTYSTYWFSDNNLNLGNFNMMPNGFRLAENTTNWTNGLGYWEGPKGGFALLFYTSIYAIEGNRRIVVEDHLDTSPFDKNGNISYNADWISVRWRRRLTSDELGYKLYITAVDSVRSSSEWTSMQNGDEIPLLKKIKSRGFPGTGFNIVQQTVAAQAPANYTELPNGYIRGFYVQHVLNSSSPANIDSIMSYAWHVDDLVLGAKEQTRRGKASEDTENSLEDVSNGGVKALSVYPNPVSDVLHIDSESLVVSVKIYSSTGSLVKRMDDVGKSMDTSILQSGIYTFVIQTEKENRTFRIVKK